MLNVTGNPELYFAEFMVHGKMNLYCITHNSDEFYFFEREDGEIAELANRATNYSGGEKNALQGVKDNIQEKREQYGKVKSLLQKSWKAVEGMDDDNMSRKKLIDVVRDYHNDVCTDGGMCMVYEYNEKSDKIKAHFKAFAGYAYYSKEKTNRQHFVDENYPGGVMEMGIGMEIELERVMKGSGLELGLSFSPKMSSEHDLIEGGYTFRSIYEKGRLNVYLGVVKRFGVGKVQPLVRGGGFVVSHFGTKEAYYSNSYKEYEKNYQSTTHFGGYLGAGVQIALGKYYARLHGDWYKSMGSSSFSDMTKLGITAEFGF